MALCTELSVMHTKLAELKIPVPQKSELIALLLSLQQIFVADHLGAS
jgi:hypothetical protein